MNHKIVVFSDTHIDATYTYSTSPNPFSDIFFKKAYYSALEPIEYAAHNGIKYLIHAGDWFDKERISAHELGVSYLLLNKVRDHQLHLYINSGNHEIDYKEGMPSIIQSMALGNASVSCLPNNVPFQCFNIDGLNVYFIKYTADVKFHEILSQVCAEVRQPAALVIHQNIKGIALGKTVLPTGLSDSELSNKLRSVFKFMVCGHIHHASYSNKFSFPIIIPGSTCAFDFRDEGTKKSFAVLELNGNYDLIDVQEKSINASIDFITITPEQYLPKFAYNNFFVKVQIDTGDNFEALKEKIMAQGAVQVIPELIKNTNYKEAMAGYARPLDMNIDNWLDKFLDNLGCDIEEKAYLKKLNEELFSERK